VPPAFISQDLEALYQNLWGAITYLGVWRVPHYSPVTGAIYAYAIHGGIYQALAAYLRGFRTNRTVTTFTGGSSWLVAELSITAHSLTLVKYDNLNPPNRTQYIVPRYVRL
jgi:hypothetical protein